MCAVQTTRLFFPHSTNNDYIPLFYMFFFVWGSAGALNVRDVSRGPRAPYARKSVTRRAKMLALRLKKY